MVRVERRQSSLSTISHIALPINNVHELRHDKFWLMAWRHSLLSLLSEELAKKGLLTTRSNKNRYSTKHCHGYYVERSSHKRQPISRGEGRASRGMSFVFLYKIKLTAFNSSSPSAAYMRQWTGPALVQIMACRLFGAKPLSKPMLGYCQLDHQEQTSVKF